MSAAPSINKCRKSLCITLLCQDCETMPWSNVFSSAFWCVLRRFWHHVTFLWWGVNCFPPKPKKLMSSALLELVFCILCTVSQISSVRVTRGPCSSEVACVDPRTCCPGLLSPRLSRTEAHPEHKPEFKCTKPTFQSFNKGEAFNWFKWMFQKQFKHVEDGAKFEKVYMYPASFNC